MILKKIYYDNIPITSEYIYKRFFNFVLKDHNDLLFFKNILNTSLNVSLKSDKLVAAIDFAPKMFLGLILRCIKYSVKISNKGNKNNKLSYVHLTEEIVGNRISRDQRLLWMKASEIINYDNMEKFYRLGITLIKKLVRLL